MKWQVSLLAAVCFASQARTQTIGLESPRVTPADGRDSVQQPLPTPLPFRTAATQLANPNNPSRYQEANPPINFSTPGPGPGRMAGNHNFDNFIGFMSNPVFNIDPRAVTELWPIWGNTWFSTSGALPGGEISLIPSAGMYVALSEKVSVGLNQGGYGFVDFDLDKTGKFIDRFGKLRQRREFSGEREGWLNIGGFAQYTVIEDPANQFLVTAGLRWEVPTGSKDIFQGRGPVKLSPYVSLGKEIGEFHLLANLGYEFPAGSGSDTNLFYGCIHLDRKIGWLYPLVEFNWVYHTASVEVDLPTREGFINFGNFSSTGNMVNMAVGANAVLIPNKLEFGAVYTTNIASQRNFGFDGFLIKMVYRY